MAEKIRCSNCGNEIEKSEEFCYFCGEELEGIEVLEENLIDSISCPFCGSNNLKKGVVETKDIGSLTQFSTMATWYPEDEKGKIFKNGMVELYLKADGYYCKNCNKVIAIFDEKLNNW